MVSCKSIAGIQSQLFSTEFTCLLVGTIQKLSFAFELWRTFPGLSNKSRNNVLHSSINMFYLYS